MAQDSWPSPAHNARAVTDPEYEQLAARFSDDGVNGSPADPPVVSAGAGLNVTVRAEAAASVRGHAWYSGTSPVTLPIAPNATGQPRTDRVVLRLDRATWTVRAVILQGTPGSGAPPLTRDTGSTGTWEVLLAQVTVPAAATSVTVVRSELYIGTRVRPALSTQLNPYPDLGEMAYETNTGRMRVWNGSSWSLLLDGSGVVSINSPLAAWSNEVESVLEQKNGVVHLRLGAFERLVGTLSAGDESRLPVLIPPAYRHPTRDQYVIAYITGLEIGRMVIGAASSDRAGQVWLTHHPAIPKGSHVLPSSGVSWVVN
ncbi:hypothetical protein [Streptomyces liangshanensis]|uniref:hypothetical protein n=1 Tax=Streptomyces liangshanensis TaxID=2717324 RepID=UPI0036DC4A65